MPPPPETFSDDQVICALQQFLEFGEKTYLPECDDNTAPVKGHRGYFSGPGWAARCLRYHLAQCQTEALRRRVAPVAPPP